MGKKSIALFLSTLTSPMHKDISLGAMDCAKKYHYNIIIYSGSSLQANTQYSHFRENIFNFVSPETIGGIIIPSSSLARHISEEKFNIFLKRYRDFPIVTISGNHREYVNIQPDYVAGMRELVTHLIEEHNYKKIVLLRGPKTNKSSNDRQEGYESALREHQIEIDEDLIFYEDINSSIGKETVEDLLAEKTDFDAIVTVNDTIAQSVITTLQKHKIKVPEDIAVCGYQGRFESAFFSPPLTTCDEDAYRQGWLAAESMIGILQGEEVSRTVKFKTPLILRKSCGCKDLYQEAQLPHDIDSNNEVIEHYSRLIREDADRDLKKITNKIIEHKTQEIKTNKDKIVSLFRHITRSLSLSGNIVDAIHLMSRIIGLKHCYIMFYNNLNVHSEEIIFHHAFVNNKDLVIEEKDKLFSRDQLIPNHYLPREEGYSLLVEPLYFREMGIGYIIFDHCYRDGIVFETIKELIGSSIYTEYQYTQTKLAKDRFSAIAYSTSDWLWEVDENLNFTFSSEGAYEVIGYREEEILGKSLFSFLKPGEDGTEDILKNYYISNKKEIDSIECWCCSKEGPKKALLISGTSVVDETGQLKGYRGAFKDITESKAAQEKISHMAYYDQLTGLANRSFFMEKLRFFIKEGKREKKELAVFFMDLDRFKFINDTLGHDHGDELLREVTKNVNEVIRSSDVFARFGGDEFVLLVRNLKSVGEYNAFARKLIKAVAQDTFVFEQAINITGSIGIALFPRDGDSGDILLKKADMAMYKAKEEGKNKFYFYEPDMDRQSKERLDIESQLLKGLDRGEFRLVYQPIYTCRDRQLYSCEALLRWHNVKLGEVSPQSFIPIAEDINSIDRIGDFVINETLAQLKEWQNGHSSLKVSINLSVKQFNDPGLAEKIIHKIHKAGLDETRIEIEITENIFIVETEKILTQLNILSEHGIKILLDDFGTGYSSLSYLQKFPIDTVKIDKSFVFGLHSDKNALSLIKAIINMAHSLNKTVIAEGVETKEQLEILQGLNCDYVQGYYLSKPLLPGEIL
ncbi:MAG: EAL domain-containing protein [Spirochaetales bacterium]|nr:EAL domain-containing protein [Spirochaetales bacterium]